MNKPDWKDAPEWAKYLASDESGLWFWYKSKPRANYYHLQWFDYTGPVKLAGNSERKPEWEETLESRPE